MRVRYMTRMMLLFAILFAFAQAQVVLTDDADTSSFSAKTNYGSSSNTHLKFTFANLGPGITSSGPTLETRDSLSTDLHGYDLHG